MFTFLKTLRRLSNRQQPDQIQKKHSSQELIQWATGCILEGLPDNFYQARLLSMRLPNPANPDSWIMSVNHDFMLSPDSDYERFQPADDLYPTQCIEMLLEGKMWHKATMIFTPEKTTFSWE